MASARVAVAHTLTELRSQFQQIIEKAAAFERDSDVDVFARRPGPNRWSPAECFTHLNISIDPYFPMWRHALLTKRPEPREGPFSLDFWGRVLVWTLEPPPRFRFPTPETFQPLDAGPREVVIPAFLERQRAILGIIDAAHGAPIDTIKIRSPFAERVRYTIWSSFCVTAAHERRHLWQAFQAVSAGQVGDVRVARR